MFNHKKLACIFFFILTLFWLVCANTAQGMDQEDEDYTKFVTSPLSPSKASLLSGAPISGQNSTVSLRSMESNPSSDLDKLFGHTVSRIAVPESVRQIVSGAASLVPLFPTGQVFVPTAMIGLLSLGLNKNVVPDTGWQSWALVAAVGVPIAIAAIVATYNGASQFFKPSSPQVTQVQDRLFERDFSRPESWSRSYPVQFVQLLFWGGIFFGLLMNTESRVSGWGDYRILGGIFGALALIPIYFIFVRATNQVDRYTYRRYKSKDEEALKEACLAPVVTVKESIKTSGLTPETKDLGVDLNVIETPLSSNVTVHAINSRSSVLMEGGHDEESQSHDGERQSMASSVPVIDSTDSIVSRQLPSFPSISQTSISEELAKPKYQRVFEKMIVISKTVPQWIKTWDYGSTKIAKYASRVVQVASTPVQSLIAYALPYTLLNYAGLSPGASIGISVVTSAAYTLVFLPLQAIKENGLLWKEYEQIFRLFKPQTTCGYFGERIAPVIARCGALVYFTFPVTDYIRNNLLDKAVGISNVPAQIIILAPLVGGIGFAIPAQFLDRTYTILSNWVAKGGPVHIPTPCCNSDCSFKLFGCFDRNGERAQALELVERLQEMEDNTFKLSKAFTNTLGAQLNIIPTSLESSSLLAGQQTD